MILDTSAHSATADGEEAAMEVARQSASIAVRVIVLGEYRLVIGQSRHHSKYESWLREWISSADGLEVEEQTATLYAALALELKKQGTPVPTNDLWIAAQCA